VGGQARSNLISLVFQKQFSVSLPGAHGEEEIK
jgi:hypothetical protein